MPAPGREEIEAARARVAAVDAQIATLEKSKHDATVLAPISGIVTERLLDPGEMAAPRAPIVVLAISTMRGPKSSWTSRSAAHQARAGGDCVHRRRRPGFPAKSAYIASKAEFTPRNVQTAEDRSKLVYRVKIAVDNRKGVLKQGMPVEAEIPLQ